MKIRNKTRVIALFAIVACVFSAVFVPTGALSADGGGLYQAVAEPAVFSAAERTTPSDAFSLPERKLQSPSGETEVITTSTVAVTEPKTPSEAPAAKKEAFEYPKESEYVGSEYRVTGFKEIDLTNLFPDNFIGDTSWDPMGIDENGVIYFGYTGRRFDLIPNKVIEDFAVFSYNPEKDVVKLLGTFIESSKASHNYVEGEAIPKGHTKFHCIDSKVYMASQGFHDFKAGIDGYENYRGAHLYMYDIAKEALIDISASMPGGVWVEHQGVVSMNYMPEIGKLVGFTHPLADLVFYDVKTNKIDRFVKGIPWQLGNPLSRELVVTGDKVYLYRGVEDCGYRAEQLEWPVYCYDYGDDTLTNTGEMMRGGFWNGQAITSDGKTAYISGCCSFLYKMDLETGKVTFLRDMDLDGESRLGFTYSISMSPDEKKLFYIPTAINPGRIYEYDIATNTVTTIANVECDVYCGSNIVTKDNWYYFVRFGNGGAWEGNPSVVAFRIESW